jgi:hypothetical protein
MLFWKLGGRLAEIDAYAKRHFALDWHPLVYV